MGYTFGMDQEEPGFTIHKPTWMQWCRLLQARHITCNKLVLITGELAPTPEFRRVAPHDCEEHVSPLQKNPPARQRHPNYTLEGPGNFKKNSVTPSTR